jgi:hypothetical protein
MDEGDVGLRLGNLEGNALNQELELAELLKYKTSLK